MAESASKLHLSLPLVEICPPSICTTTSWAGEAHFCLEGGLRLASASLAPTWAGISLILLWLLTGRAWTVNVSRLLWAFRKLCNAPCSLWILARSGWVEVPKTDVVEGVLCQPHAGFLHLCFWILTLCSVKTAWNLDLVNPVLLSLWPHLGQTL